MHSESSWNNHFVRCSYNNDALSSQKGFASTDSELAMNDLLSAFGPSSVFIGFKTNGEFAGAVSPRSNPLVVKS